MFHYIDFIKYKSWNHHSTIEQYLLVSAFHEAFFDTVFNKRMGVGKSGFTEDPGITTPLPISNSGKFSFLE